MKREDITKLKAAVLECASIWSAAILAAKRAQHAHLFALSRSCGHGCPRSVCRPHSKFGATHYNSLESSFRSNGPVNFIARRADGDDHARGFDFRQRHDDPFDFDAAGTSCGSHTLAFGSSATTDDGRGDERVSRRRTRDALWAARHADQPITIASA